MKDQVKYLVFMRLMTSTYARPQQRLKNGHFIIVIRTKTDLRIFAMIPRHWHDYYETNDFRKY